jgi:hypothetical protein
VSPIFRTHRRRTWRRIRRPAYISSDSEGTGEGIEDLQVSFGDEASEDASDADTGDAFSDISAASEEVALDAEILAMESSPTTDAERVAHALEVRAQLFLCVFIVPPQQGANF